MECWVGDTRDGVGEGGRGKVVEVIELGGQGGRPERFMEV